MMKTMFIYIISIALVLGACSKDNDTQVDHSSPEDTSDTYVPQPKPDIKITLADPTIFYDEDSDKYYLYGTSGSDVVHKGFKVFVSEDLKHWERHKGLVLSKKDVFGTDDFWAPQVFKYNGKYYMAYAANQQIGIAESNSPLGPFKQTVKAPVHDETYQNIDPYVFFDEDSTAYLYYDRLGGGNWLFAAELNNDLTDIVPGTATSCINAVNDPQPWENVDQSTPITEGPTVIKHQGTYYFFYSANNYQSPNYAVGYATANDPYGPWSKYSENPVLSKALIEENGPGHGDMFQDREGHYYYVFHTHYSKYDVQPRCTAIIKGKFVSKGKGMDTFEFDPDSFHYLTIEQN